jgi:hypothetical protein
MQTFLSEGSDRRLEAISRCTDEIAQAVKFQRPGELGGLLWEMDWRSELHRLIHEGERW